MAKRKQLQDQLEGLFSDLSTPEPLVSGSPAPEPIDDNVLSFLQETAENAPSPQPTAVQTEESASEPGSPQPEEPMGPEWPPPVAPTPELSHMASSEQGPTPPPGAAQDSFSDEEAPDVQDAQPAAAPKAEQRKRRVQLTAAHRLFIAFLIIASVPILILMAFGRLPWVALIALAVSALLALQLVQQFTRKLAADATQPGHDELSELVGSAVESGTDNLTRERLVDLEATTAQLDEHAAGLEKGAEICRIVTSSLDPQEVTQMAVDLICANYGLHNASLFLVDQRGEWATVAASTGDQGRQMMALPYRLAVDGASLVGWVCEHGQSRTATEVDPQWTHPLLPDSRCEVALPLRVSDRLLGVLDLHSTEPGAVDGSNVGVFQTIADSVAVALHNARLYDKTQRGARHQQIATRVTDRLQQTMGIDEILALTLTQLGETFDLAEAAICLGTEAELQSAGNGRERRED